MKKVLSLLLSVVLLICAAPTITAFATDEEATEAYIGIYNIEDLYGIRYALDKSYILMNDIDMTADTAPGGDWDNGFGWAPIGENESLAFSGTFDGNGHTIKGMQINGIKTNYAGLFGYVKGTIKNLTIEDISIVAGNINDAGGLAGYAADSQLTNIEIKGDIKHTSSLKSSCTGGLVGYAKNTNFERCKNYASVYGATDYYEQYYYNYYGNSYSGGIVGCTGTDVTISYCNNSGKIQSVAKVEACAGGISGSGGTIKHSYNTGEVYGESTYKDKNFDCYACGISVGGTIENCYNTGEICAKDSFSYTSPTHSYACGISTGTVSNSINLGALEGDSKSSITNESCSYCYYLRGTAPSGKYGASDTAATAVALSAAQIKLQSVFGYLDFEDVWFLDTSTGVEHPQLISNPEKSSSHHHNYTSSVTAPTCTQKGYTTYTCSCSDSYVSDYVDALGHDFGEWEVTTEPTCTSAGVETRYCSRCEETETREITKINHTYTTSVTAPTCTQKGYTTYTCSCGETYNSDYVDALGHDFGEWEVTTEPTCTSTGVETRYCSRYDATETRVIQKTNHNYVSTITAPTCTQKGYTTYTCSCGETYKADYVDALGHDFGEWKVTAEPTCTSTGVETRYCSRCDATETRVIKKINHNYVSTVTAPTCTQKGYTTYTCSCGETYKADYVDALGHDYKAVVTAPTCTEQGFTTYTCSRCYDSYKSDYVPAKGHTDGEWKITKEPTLTQEGEKMLYCKECGQPIRTESIPKLTHGQVHTVSIDDVSLNYKKSATLNPTIDIDDGVNYTVTYTSSDNSVATVDENGNVTATKRGSGNATITCTVTDEYGNTVKDTCNVKVSLNFGQILIVYILFGWIWY